MGDPQPKGFRQARLQKNGPILALGLAIRPRVKRRGPSFIYASDRAELCHQLTLEVAVLVAV